MYENFTGKVIFELHSAKYHLTKSNHPIPFQMKNVEESVAYL
jgi:hypothetical protein